MNCSDATIRPSTRHEKQPFRRIPKTLMWYTLVRNRPRRRIRDLRLHKQRPLHSLNFIRPQRPCADRDRRSRKKETSKCIIGHSDKKRKKRIQNIQNWARSRHCLDEGKLILRQFLLSVGSFAFAGINAAAFMNTMPVLVSPAEKCTPTTPRSIVIRRRGTADQRIYRKELPIIPSPLPNKHLLPSRASSATAHTKRNREGRLESKRHLL